MDSRSCSLAYLDAVVGCRLLLPMFGRYAAAAEARMDASISIYIAAQQ